MAYAPAAWTDFGTAVGDRGGRARRAPVHRGVHQPPPDLAGKSLPSRAGQTLTLFTTPLIAGVLLIVPGQARIALALELLAAGLVIGGFQVYLDLTTERGDEDTVSRRKLGRVLPAIVSCGCLVTGGATLAAQAGGGLYWLVPGVLSAIIFGLINVWVLLVEILR
jgi:hypothetical protein